MPPRFDLEVALTLLDSSDRLLCALGTVNQLDHQLTGLWIRLTARHAETGYYELEAFAEKPDLRDPRDRHFSNWESPKVTGFVRVEKHST
jgi:hypothetical protein